MQEIRVIAQRVCTKVYGGYATITEHSLYTYMPKYYLIYEE